MLINRNPNKEQRRSVLERDGYQCRYCGSRQGPFELDHVYPVSKGGKTTLENLVTACRTCNHNKSDTAGIYPKPIGYFDKTPRKPKKRAIKADVFVGRSGIVVGLVAITLGMFVKFPVSRYPISPTILETIGILIVAIGSYLLYQGSIE